MPNLSCSIANWIRHLLQFKTAILEHRCLIHAVPLVKKWTMAANRKKNNYNNKTILLILLTQCKIFELPRVAINKKDLPPKVTIWRLTIDQYIINYNDNCSTKDFNFSIIKKIILKKTKQNCIACQEGKISRFVMGRNIRTVISHFFIYRSWKWILTIFRSLSYSSKT